MQRAGVFCVVFHAQKNFIWAIKTLLMFNPIYRHGFPWFNKNGISMAREQGWHIVTIALQENLYYWITQFSCSAHPWSTYISKTNHLQSGRLDYPLAGEHHPPRCSLALTTGVASKLSVVFPTFHGNPYSPRNFTHIVSENKWFFFLNIIFFPFIFNNTFMCFFKMMLGNMLQQLHTRFELFCTLFTWMLFMLGKYLFV